MEGHERQCVERRLAMSPVATELHCRNIFREPPAKRWLDGFDAVIIGGSGRFSVQDERSTAWLGGLRHLLDAILTRELPGFGICFGHQLLGLHFGASVQTHPALSEAGTVGVHLTASGRQDALFSQLPQIFSVHTGHSDSVMNVPAGLTALACNSRLATQAFAVDGGCFYSTQFHPDVTGQEAQNRYAAYEAGLDALLEEPNRRSRVQFDATRDDTEPMLSIFLSQAATPDSAILKHSA